jgi:hypothetical protein
MARLWELTCGVWELARLLAASRFRLGGAYWRWRRETAFGSDPARRPPLRERVRQIVAYGVWVHRMRRSD